MQVFETNGRHVHYLMNRAGKNAQTLVFANSLGTDLRIWDIVADELGSQFNILRIDKPGHGLSQTNGFETTAQALAEDVIAAMAAESIKSGILVGLSIGGLVVQEVCRLRPDLVAKLVLTNTASKLGSSELWAERLQLIESNGLSSMVDGVLDRWFSEEFRALHPGRFAAARIMLSQTSDEGYMAACTALRDADLRQSARQIKVPVQCIAGSNDLATPEEVVREMADNIPGSKLAVLESVGHIPCLEEPQGFCKIIRDFAG